jgi:hypothetical protein
VKDVKEDYQEGNIANHHHTDIQHLSTGKVRLRRTEQKMGSRTSEVGLRTLQRYIGCKQTGHEEKVVC